MNQKIIKIILLVLVSQTTWAQFGGNSLLYDIGLMIEDSLNTNSDMDSTLVNRSQGDASQEQLVLEEELNRYQQKLAETEVRLRYQTMIIDSLQTEIAHIKAAGETDKALLTTRITHLVGEQQKSQQKSVVNPGLTDVSDSVFAELETPWQAKPVSVQTPAKVMTGPPLSNQEEQKFYRSGLTRFHQTNYYQAIDDFNTIVQRGRDITLKANAQYWVGRCYYEKGLYDEAIAAFEQVQRYKYSDKLDDALVMIGLAFKNKDRMPEAKLAFQELVTRHPGSEYLTLARRFVQ